MTVEEKIEILNKLSKEDLIKIILDMPYGTTIVPFEKPADYQIHPYECPPYKPYDVYYTTVS